MEVKGVTLEDRGIVRFPDAPSERAVKHVEELVAAKRQGYRAFVLFVVQMEDVRIRLLLSYHFRRGMHIAPSLFFPKFFLNVSLMQGASPSVVLHPQQGHPSGICGRPVQSGPGGGGDPGL